jgi:hypothetical protein
MPLLIYFAFPNNEDIPSSYAQSGNVLRIALPISLNLWNPIIPAGFWFANALCAVMTMPKATVNKNSYFGQPMRDRAFPVSLCGGCDSL